MHVLLQAAAARPVSPSCGPSATANRLAPGVRHERRGDACNGQKENGPLPAYRSPLHSSNQTRSDDLVVFEGKVSSCRRVRMSSSALTRRETAVCHVRKLPRCSACILESMPRPRFVLWSSHRLPLRIRSHVYSTTLSAKKVRYRSELPNPPTHRHARPQPHKHASL